MKNTKKKIDEVVKFFNSSLEEAARERNLSNKEHATQEEADASADELIRNMRLHAHDLIREVEEEAQADLRKRFDKKLRKFGVTCSVLENEHQKAFKRAA